MKSKLLFAKAVIKNNAVMFIAMICAIITCFIVPPDEQYVQYFDFKTLTCLFSVLAVVCALRNVRFFYTLARKIVKSFSVFLDFARVILYNNTVYFIKGES